MSEAEEPRRCATCATPIPPGFPDGLCPRCLLVTGVHATGASGSSWSGQGRTAGEGGRSIEDWQGVFPGLEILGPLGAGGMGMVFKARQPRLDRTVALKIMACPPGGPEDFARRFESKNPDSHISRQITNHWVSGSLHASSSSTAAKTPVLTTAA